MADDLLSRLPESIGLNHPCPDMWQSGGILDTGPQRINYFINYSLLLHKTTKLDAALFTHPEPDGLFWKIGRLVDLPVCMCDQYCEALRKMECRAVTILPGVEASFTPKLVLGFVGRFSCYGARKGVDLLKQVSELDFVELVITNEQLAPEDLPAFYRRLDYVIITSRYEGGPMCLLEGLACGKKVICPPDVGFADRFPNGIVPYAKGDFASLAQTLRMLYEEKLQLADLVREYTWDRWALEHLRVFTALLRGKTP